MNLRDRNLLYSCLDCPDSTETLHEIYGGSANKKISIKHKFQVPLCMNCHDIYHRHLDRMQKQNKKEKYLNWLGNYDYWKVTQRYNNYLDNKSWFYSVTHANIDKLMSMVI